MVLFSSGFMAFYHAYKVVIPFEILLVEEVTVLWIIGCSIFVVVALQKRKNREDNEKSKK